MYGTLYLIPCPISDETAPWDVLPAANRAVMDSLDYFIVENTRSARRFMAKAGIVEQAKDRKEIVIDKVYRIDDEKTGRFVMVLPYDGFRVSFTSLNPHKLIGVQYEDFHVDEAVYHKEIAPARTIAYEKEIQALREMGLGLGGSLENVIVYNDEGWLNPLHFEDELVRHKILDVIGDLRLAGIIRGHVIAVASGHALNTQLAKQIAAAFAHQ